jgi:ribosomal protein S27E
LASGKGAVVIGPWLLGSYLAVQFGAANPSLARTITGWVFEVPWLVFLAFVVHRINRAKKQSADRKRALAQPAGQAQKTAAHEKTTNVRCYNCQHVQTVPGSQETFACEQCKAHLKRRTAPADSS